MDQFCTSQFWDLNVTWYTTSPDFTSCFQNTVLSWVPLGFLLLVLPYELWTQASSRYALIPWNNLNILKLLLGAVQILLSLAIIIYNVIVYEDGQYLPVTVANIVYAISYLIVFLLVYRGRLKGIHSSGSLFNFWMLHVVCSVLIYRSYILRTLYSEELLEIIHLAAYLASFPLILLQFLLSCWADHEPRVNFDKKYVKANVCPEESHSLLSQVLYWWFNPMIMKGYKSPLKEEDQWSLAPNYQCVKLAETFDKFLKKGIDKNNTPSILPAMWSTFRAPFVAGVIYKLIADIFMFVSPLVLNYLISYVTSDEPLWKGLFYAFLMFTAGEINSLLQNQYFYLMLCIAMKVRSALIGAIYSKALKLSNEERKGSTVGEIVNLMSVDTQRFLDVIPFFNVIWSGPLQIIISCYLLWQYLGVAVLTGVAIIVFLIPVNGVIAKLYHTLQVDNMNLKDERTKMMNEILNGIKVLKLYAWENAFIDQVLQVRNKEVKQLQTMAYLTAATNMAWTSVIFMVAIGSFTTFIFIDDNNVLTANVAFVSMSLFNLLRFPMLMIPHLISFIIQTGVSVTRINKFLAGQELDLSSISHDRTSEHAISVENGSFSWEKSADTPVLKNINLKVDHGSLVAIVGRVGSGKSSLISAILGELHKINGRVNIKSNIAYVPQTAWIRNATIKNNVIMFNETVESKYEEIINACSLKSDLEIMPGGDRTEIGEKGINLSGGQKQRISIARAAYHQADIYLMDDPLSAVDSHVGKHIFDNVVGSKGLLANTTRVMVTNNLSYLPQCDHIVMLKDGAVEETGTYKELMQKDGAFVEFVIQHINENQDDLSADEKILEEIKGIAADSERQRTLSRSISRRSGSIKDMPIADVGEVEETSDKAKLTEEEEVGQGSVNWRVYYQYALIMGRCIFFCFSLSFLMAEVSIAGANIWLSDWSNDPRPLNNDDGAALRDLRLGIYGLLGSLEAIFVFIGAVGFAYGVIKVSNHLHKNMLYNIMRSPMSFFDTTPMGRIINRFSKDLNVLDVNIIWNMTDMITTLIRVLVTMVVIALQTVEFLIVVVPIGLIFYAIQKLYIVTSRQLKRIESKTRSPIYVHFSESLSGVSSIRAYNLQDRFINESNKMVDNNQECYFPSIVANRWLSIRTEFMANLVVLFAALFAVLSKGYINPGSVGLSLSYASSITQELNWMVRMVSELETNMVSAERLIEYSQLPEEADWKKPETEPKDGWPDVGNIQFTSYSTRYRANLDLVLKQIKCNIKPLEKIGICGRTGAGKSSLTLALFRIIEAAEGQISIDGIDISRLGLHDLRSKLTIIPQDPVLFSGTLRRNLDPFSQFEDSSIWNALEHAHLKQFVTTLNGLLEFEVSEGGDNLSVGQRQLVCLARALLRKSKILILDEATAAVDPETDGLIQNTIRSYFKDCTIITIAHRLHTIMDSTRVLVLDKGEIAEFDTPTNLLSNSKSIFYGMAKDAGLV